MSERFAATPEAAHDVADALAPVAPELGERTAMDLRLLATELVANAVRHTGVEGGTVEVEVRIAPRIVHLSVIDDGPGFDAAGAADRHARRAGRLGPVPRRPVRGPLGRSNGPSATASGWSSRGDHD